MTSRRRFRGVAVLLVVALVGPLLAGCGTPPGSPTPEADASAPAGPASAVPIVPSAVPVPGHELYGFVPYWEMDDTIVAHLAATPLTTIGLFSVTHTGKGAIRH